MGFNSGFKGLNTKTIQNLRDFKFNIVKSVLVVVKIMHRIGKRNNYVIVSLHYISFQLRHKILTEIFHKELFSSCRARIYCLFWNTEYTFLKDILEIVFTVASISRFSIRK